MLRTKTATRILLLGSWLSINSCRTDGIVDAPSTRLRVTVSVLPNLVSLSSTNTSVRVRVVAENPEGRTLRINLGEPSVVDSAYPPVSQGWSFSFWILKPGTFETVGISSTAMSNDRTFEFGPREYHVYDTVVDLARVDFHLDPGEYEVLGAFSGQRSATRARLIVVP